MPEKEKIFESQIGIKPLMAILAIISAIYIYLIITTSSYFLIASMFGLLISLITLIQTKYAVKRGSLIIKTSFITQAVIEIDTIRTITDSGRLKIAYNKFDDIRVSPKDKTEFIDYLKSLNSSIQVTPSEQESPEVLSTSTTRTSVQKKSLRFHPENVPHEW